MVFLVIHELMKIKLVLPMMNYVEKHGTADESSLTEREKKVLQIFRERNAANRHKMIEIPRCINPLELKGN